MAEKKQKKEDRSAAGYYDLKTDAVDRLVDAKNAPEVSDAEIRKYTNKNQFRLPIFSKRYGSRNPPESGQAFSRVSPYALPASRCVPLSRSSVTS